MSSAEEWVEADRQKMLRIVEAGQWKGELRVRLMKLMGEYVNAGREMITRCDRRQDGHRVPIVWGPPPARRTDGTERDEESSKR